MSTDSPGSGIGYDGGPGTSAVHVLGPVEQIPLGEGRAFGVGGEQVAVFRLRDGSLRAVSAVCPHRGGPIADGTIDQQVVLCPLHQHAFDLRTGCSSTGAEPLRSYHVTSDQERNIVLRTGQV
ncbi:nitrite reductase/ring-hydroxylating ferredoxin subunit [Arthrobacter pascens]|uniref:Rieske (2Fe-2S) protein n=1 Tax=Arthrobacter pascens TaxID=1677 RepID=UPI0027904072|nr:Rieske 2Fe-2S domain-containing protein [Arthrobacter pascens]MDQ0677209.1 nitrite reductase/ring-hydroxylating ferredoxin subunit [Arthrobacter pascens]